MLKPRSMNEAISQKPLPSLKTTSRGNSDNEQKDSSLDTARIARLRNENRELMKMAGLNDSFFSSQTIIKSQSSKRPPSQKNFSRVNSIESDNPFNKLKERIDINTINSDRLDERLPTRETIKSRHNNYVEPENYFSEDSEDEKSRYFAYSDFDNFVDFLSKPITGADVKSKILELKDLAKSMKELTTNASGERVDEILKKFTRTVDQNNEKPYYQKFLEDQQQRKKKQGKATQEIVILHPEDQVASQQQENVKKSRSPDRSPFVAQNFNGAEFPPKDMSIASPIAEYQSKKTDKNDDDLESFLKKQGLVASLINPSGKGSPTKPFDEISPITPQNNIMSSLSPGLLQEILEYKSSNPNPGGIPSETGDLISSLQFFLLQNIREISEIKDLIKEDGVGGGGALSKLFPKKDKSFKSSDTSELDVNPLAENRAADAEKKIYETQIDRLVKKIQVLNKKVQEVEKENERFLRLDNVVKKSLKAGKVKLSDYIRWELDVNNLPIEDLSTTFEFEDKFLVISSTQISIEQKGIEKDESRSSMFGGEENYRLSIDDIDYIAYVDRPGSCYFLIKSAEAEKEKSKLGDSMRTSSLTRGNPFETKTGFYIMQVEDQRDLISWELAFFMINWKIIARNVQFSYNKKEFIQTLKMFLGRYIDYNGEAIQIFGDGMSPLSTKPPLHPSAGSSKQSSNVDPIAEIAVDSVRGSLQSGPDTSRTSGAGFAPLVSKVQTLMKLKPENQEAKEKTRQTKSLPPKRSGPIEEESEEIDEIGTSSIQQENPNYTQPIPSIEEGNGGFEENKSTISSRSQKPKQKIISPEVEEQQTFSKYLNFLVTGVAFEKYGKWGPRHERLVRVSNDFTGLEWRDPKKPKKLPDFILIDSITRIDVGTRSAYFQKKKMSDTERALCLTIASTERDLNLKAPDAKQRDMFVEALQYVLSEKAKLKKVSQFTSLAKKK